MRKRIDPLHSQFSSGTSSGSPRDEEGSPRLGEMYQDIHEFADTKLKIKALIRLKKLLVNQQSHANSEELQESHVRAMEAIDRLFRKYTLDEEGV